MAKNYAPFRDGEVETGSTGKCPHGCGAKAKNQHSLAEAGKCSWLKRSMKDRAALIEAGKSNRDMAGNFITAQGFTERRAA